MAWVPSPFYDIAMRARMVKAAAAATFCLAASPPMAQPVWRRAEAPIAVVTPVGPPEIVFSASRDACDGNDIPDAPARAFRDAAGGVVLFGLHHVNRALRGASLDRMKIDCAVALASGHKADPALYDDYSWLAATWTEDGKNIVALVHHEYHANEHQGRCAFGEMMRCWTNSVLLTLSNDGGRSFARPKGSPVVAAYPFRQETGQGRHRGFFNPSNIFSDGEWKFFFAATTGWSGQKFGACLFRTKTPPDPRSWRAWDGKGFSANPGDPYAATADPSQHCEPVAPFVTPVGAVVKHRGSGRWIAVLMASKHDDFFAEPGIWASASRDLLHWSKPTLVIAGKTLYDDPCGASSLIAYPSLLDRGARTRNFEDVGEEADLYYVTLRVEGCRITADRDLVRRNAAIKLLPYVDGDKP